MADRYKIRAIFLSVCLIVVALFPPLNFVNNNFYKVSLKWIVALKLFHVAMPPSAAHLFARLRVVFCLHESWPKGVVQQNAAESDKSRSTFAGLSQQKEDRDLAMYAHKNLQPASRTAPNTTSKLSERHRCDRNVRAMRGYFLFNCNCVFYSCPNSERHATCDTAIPVSAWSGGGCASVVACASWPVANVTEFEFQRHFTAFVTLWTCALVACLAKALCHTQFNKASANDMTSLSNNNKYGYRKKCDNIVNTLNS